MPKIETNKLFEGQKVQFIKNANFIEGTIVKIYDECFAVNIIIESNNYLNIKLEEVADYLLAYKDMAYRCNSKILGCKIGDKTELLLMDMPNILNGIERRQYPRVKVIMDIEYCFISDNVKCDKLEDIPRGYIKKMKKSFTVDLSANGIKLITYDEEISSKQALVSLFIKEQINILCSVVRVDYDEASKTYQTAMQFKDLNNNKWQYINKFVHEKLQK